MVSTQVRSRRTKGSVRWDPAKTLAKQAQEPDAPDRVQAEYIQQAVGGVRTGRQVHAADVAGVAAATSRARPCQIPVSVVSR